MIQTIRLTVYAISYEYVTKLLTIIFLSIGLSVCCGVFKFVCCRSLPEPHDNADDDDDEADKVANGAVFICPISLVDSIG